MIAVALEAEVDEYVASFVDEVGEFGGGWSCATAAPASGA